MSTISRRSFLKLAGVTAVATAGASLFASCSVASYLQVELDQTVIDEIIGKIDDENEKKAQEEKLKTYLGYVNLALAALPLVGVTNLNKEKALDTIYQAIDKIGPMFNVSAEDIANVKDMLNHFDIETDENGNLPNDSSMYNKITVKLSLKKDVDPQLVLQCL